MPGEFKRELSINVNTSVNTQKIQEAEKVIQRFFDKYDGENLKLGIDTKKAKVDVQDFSKTILRIKELSEEIGNVQTNSPSMLPAIKNDIEFLERVKEEFASVFAIFTDGSMAKGMDAIISKITDGFSVAVVDIGERVGYLKDQIINVLHEIDHLKLARYDDGSINYASGNMDEEQIQKRIKLVEQLLKYQEELELFNGNKFNVQNAPSEQDTEFLNTNLNTLREYSEQLEEYNLRTTEQLKRRNDLIADAQSTWQWKQNEQENAKNNITNDEIYNRSIEALERFIQRRKETIQKLRVSEDELFSVDAITTYVEQANKQLQRLESQKEILQNLRNGKTESGASPISTDLFGVINQLEEIKQAIIGITNAFKPLTDALSSEDSAISAMVKANLADLESLNTKVRETFKNIEILSQKDFNVNNFISEGTGIDAQTNQLREYQNVARELSRQVKALYKEAGETYQIGGTALKENPSIRIRVPLLPSSPVARF